MNWTYNVPIKFFEYDLNEFKHRLNKFKYKNALFIGSKRLIKTFDLDVDDFQIIDESIANPDIHLINNIIHFYKFLDIY